MKKIEESVRAVFFLFLCAIIGAKYIAGVYVALSGLHVWEYGPRFPERCPGL